MQATIIQLFLFHHHCLWKLKHWASPRQIDPAANISFPLITPETAGLEPMTPLLGIKPHHCQHYSIIPFSSSYTSYLQKVKMFIGLKAWVVDKSTQKNKVLVVSEKKFIWSWTLLAAINVTVSPSFCKWPPITINLEGMTLAHRSKWKGKKGISSQGKDCHQLMIKIDQWSIKLKFSTNLLSL